MRNFSTLIPMLAASVLALSGCATGPSLQSRMASYIGDPAQTLVQNLGVPDKQITVNGTQYLAYVSRHTELTPGIGGLYGGEYFGDGFYGPFYPGPFFDVDIPPRAIDYSCETTFLLHDNKVMSFSLRGNDCS